MSDLASVRTIVDSTPFDYSRAFSRNIGILSSAEQVRLRNARVAIPGCGGVGGLHAITLARLGIGRFVIADFDTFEIENMNRQFGAKISTLHCSKVEVMRREILEINPTAEVNVLAEPVTSQNVSSFLEGVDVVIDSLDFFCFEARDALFPAARRMGIPLVTGAPLGFSCALLVFTPQSMSYKDYFGFHKSDSHETRALKFMFGLAPRGTHIRYINRANVNLKGGRGPSSVIAVDLCAAMVAGEAVKLILDRGGVLATPHFAQFDTYRMKLRKGRVWLGSRNPLQRLKIWFVKRFMLPRNVQE